MRYETHGTHGTHGNKGNVCFPHNWLALEWLRRTPHAVGNWPSAGRTRHAALEYQSATGISAARMLVSWAPAVKVESWGGGILSSHAEQPATRACGPQGKDDMAHVARGKGPTMSFYPYSEETMKHRDAPIVIWCSSQRNKEQWAGFSYRVPCTSMSFFRCSVAHSTSVQ